MPTSLSQAARPGLFDGGDEVGRAVGGPQGYVQQNLAPRTTTKISISTQPHTQRSEHEARHVITPQSTTPSADRVHHSTILWRLSGVIVGAVLVIMYLPSATRVQETGGGGSGECMFRSRAG
jgi:hypothetical protein